MQRVWKGCSAICTEMGSPLSKSMLGKKCKEEATSYSSSSCYLVYIIFYILCNKVLLSVNSGSMLS